MYSGIFAFAQRTTDSPEQAEKLSFEIATILDKAPEKESTALINLLANISKSPEITDLQLNNVSILLENAREAGYAPKEDIANIKDGILQGGME